MNQFWLVWKVDGASPRHKHASEETAIQEAERLAEQHPGEVFVVLEATHARQVKLHPVMQGRDLRKEETNDVSSP